MAAIFENLPVRRFSRVQAFYGLAVAEVRHVANLRRYPGSKPHMQTVGGGRELLEQATVLTEIFWLLSPLLLNSITLCVEIGNGNVERAFSTKTVTGFNKIRTGKALIAGLACSVSSGVQVRAHGQIRHARVSFCPAKNRDTCHV